MTGTEGVCLAVWLDLKKVTPTPTHRHTHAHTYKEKDIQGWPALSPPSRAYCSYPSSFLVLQVLPLLLMRVYHSNFPNNTPLQRQTQIRVHFHCNCRNCLCQRKTLYLKFWWSDYNCRIRWLVHWLRKICEPWGLWKLFKTHRMKSKMHSCSSKN